MTQLISTPTRVTNDTATCIDIIATSAPDLVCLAATLDTGVSDHYAVFCTLNCKVARSKTYKREVWIHERADYNGLNEALNQIDWNSKFQNLKVNDMVCKWTDIFVETAKQYIPTKTITIRPGDPPWLTTSIKRPPIHCAIHRAMVARFNR